MEFDTHFVELHVEVAGFEIEVGQINAERKVRECITGDVDLKGRGGDNARQTHLSGEVAEDGQFERLIEDLEVEVEIDGELLGRVVVVSIEVADEALALECVEQAEQVGLHVRYLRRCKILLCGRLKVQRIVQVSGRDEIEDRFVDQRQLRIERGIVGDDFRVLGEFAERVQDLLLQAEVGEIVFERDVGLRVLCKDIRDIDQHGRESGGDDIERKFRLEDTDGADTYGDAADFGGVDFSVFVRVAECERSIDVEVHAATDDADGLAVHRDAEIDVGRVDIDGCANVVELHVEIRGGECFVGKVDPERDVRVDFAIDVHFQSGCEVEACVLGFLSKLEFETLDTRGCGEVESEFVGLRGLIVERSERSGDALGMVFQRAEESDECREVRAFDALEIVLRDIVQLERRFDVFRVHNLSDGLVDERQGRGECGICDDGCGESIRSIEGIEDERLQAGIDVEAESELRLRSRCEYVGHGDEQRAEICGGDVEWKLGREDARWVDAECRRLHLRSRDFAVVVRVADAELCERIQSDGAVFDSYGSAVEIESECAAAGVHGRPGGKLFDFHVEIGSGDVCIGEVHAERKLRRRRRIDADFHRIRENESVCRCAVGDSLQLLIDEVDRL